MRGVISVVEFDRVYQVAPVKLCRRTTPARVKFPPARLTRELHGRKPHTRFREQIPPAPNQSQNNTGTRGIASWSEVCTCRRGRASEGWDAQAAQAAVDPCSLRVSWDSPSEFIVVCTMQRSTPSTHYCTWTPKAARVDSQSGVRDRGLSG